MTTHTERGYAEGDYGVDDYLMALRAATDGAQFEATIVTDASVGAQFEGVVTTDDSLGAQFEGSIDAEESSGAQFEGAIGVFESFGAQFDAVTTVDQSLGAQFEGDVDGSGGMGVQFEAGIGLSGSAAGQVEGSIVAAAAFGAQLDAQLNGIKGPLGAEFLSTNIFHRVCGYATGAYGVDPYAAPKTCAQMRAQFQAIINKGDGVGAQFDAQVETSTHFGAQFQGEIHVNTGLGAQFLSIKQQSFGSQMRAVLYNTNRLRVLYEFLSRGTSQTNWTATSTETGDFDVNNVNTDIVEQVWKSAAGDKTGVQLVCDTEIPQGVFLDTFAMLNHNLSTSASVFLDGSNDATFNTGVETIVLQVTTNNLYYLAPELPNNGYRYWRIRIEDSSNPDNQISIGTILFGQATILFSSCFSNPVRTGQRHFVDTVMTEGFTNTQNDRGLKRYVGLDFQRLNINSGDYENLQEIFEFVRTNLKALWIPTPQYPERYATFGKMTEMPAETHDDLGEDNALADFSIDIDESR